MLVRNFYAEGSMLVRTDIRAQSIDEPLLDAPAD
jgi:hypothetical protein